MMTFDVITKRDLSLDIIKSQISKLRSENTANYSKDRGKLLDFYEGRQNQDEYLGNYFKDAPDFPFMTVNITKKIIDKISLLYKYSPDRYLDGNEDYNEFISENPSFDVSRKTAERYKKLLGAILYMPLITESGYKPSIFYDWQPYFSASDKLNPIAYSIAIDNDITSKDAQEQTYLFVSDEHWFLHNEHGDKKWPDPMLGTDDMINPLGILPVVEERVNFPVSNYWADGAVSLIEGNQSLNMLINDLAGLIRYQSWNDKYVTGVNADELSLKAGWNQWHIAGKTDATFGNLSNTAQIEAVTDSIERLTNWIAAPYNINMKFSVDGAPPSGFSLLVQNIDLLEAREDDIGFAKMAEHKIYNIIQRQTEVFDVGFKLPKDGNLVVDFKEGINLPINQAEDDAHWEWLFNWNIATPIDRIQKDNPDMSEEDAQGKYGRNKSTNENLTQGQQAFRNVLQEINEPETDTQE